MGSCMHVSTDDTEPAIQACKHLALSPSKQALFPSLGCYGMFNKPSASTS